MGKGLSKCYTPFREGGGQTAEKNVDVIYGRSQRRSELLVNLRFFGVFY